MVRLLPLGLSGLSTLIASIADVNFAYVAGGITGIGMAGAGVWWKVEQNKLSIFRENQKAKLEAYRESELARIEIQCKQDEANKDSLSAQLAGMTSQLTAIQHSADEANRSLQDARDFNSTLKQRLEDANEKLHTVLNDENVRKLQHEVELRELNLAKKAVEDRYDELARKFDAAHSQNLALMAKVGEKIDDTKAQAELNAARLDGIASGLTPDPDRRN